MCQGVLLQGKTEKWGHTRKFCLFTKGNDPAGREKLLRQKREIISDAKSLSRREGIRATEKVDSRRKSREYGFRYNRW